MVNKEIIALWEGLTLDEKKTICELSEEKGKKYGIYPWVRYFEVVILEEGKPAMKENKQYLTGHVKPRLKVGKMKTLEMFLECYNQVKGTNIKIFLDDVS